jgi:hypothetical protein
MFKAKMSVKERELRSKLTKASAFNEIVRGVVNVRAKKCMNNGKRYATMYLMHMKNGKMEQIYIPRGWEERVRKWVKKYREMEKYMEEISDIYLKKIKKREE